MNCLKKLVPKLNMFKNIKPVIAIDGTASSGKGTLAKKISKLINFDHLDTGTLYRSLSLFMIKENLTLSDLVKMDINKFDITNINNKELRTEIISKHSSIISKNKNIRKLLLNFQREFANNPPNGNGSVIDGRDITSVIIPKAEVKFFVDAELKTRARRRFKENSELNLKKSVIFSELYSELEKRDLRDRNRSISPLIQTSDSILIDTTKLSINQTLNIAVKHIKSILNIKTN